MPDLEERVAALEAALAPADFSLLPLRPDEIRQLLRECVTVVKPGETLIVRVPVTWVPDQVSNYQKNFSDWARLLDLPFKVIVVIGEELGVAEPGGVPGAA